MVFLYASCGQARSNMNLKKNNNNLRLFSPSGCIEVVSTAKYQAAGTENGKTASQNNSVNETMFTSDVFSVAELPLSSFGWDGSQACILQYLSLQYYQKSACFLKGDTVFIIVMGLYIYLESNRLHENTFWGFQLKSKIWDRLQCLGIFLLFYLKQKYLVQILPWCNFPKVQWLGKN